MPARQFRITSGDDYRRVVRRGRRAGGAYCITYVLPRKRTDPARFGFIVSKSVGGAVVRNLVRRRLKTVADRYLRTDDHGFDVVFRALPGSAQASYAELEAEALGAVRKLVTAQTSVHRSAVHKPAVRS